MQGTGDLPAISLLGYNLCNLLEAAEEDSPLPEGEEVTEEDLFSNLYPNLLSREQNVNFQTAGPHEWVSPVLWGASRISRVKDILEYTHQVLHSYIKTLAEHLDGYEAYLMSKCHGEKADDYAITATTNFILDFYNETHKFLHAAKSGKYWRIQALFQQNVFCKDCFRCYEKAKNYYCIIDMHAQLGAHIPFKLLLEASLQQELDKAEDLKNFVENCIQSSITTRVLHNGLKASLQHMIENHVTQSQVKTGTYPDLKYLEHMLEVAPLGSSHGESTNGLMTQEDPVHIEWRASVGPGQVLKSTSIEPVGKGGWRMTIHEITLGEQVGKKEKGFDHNLYFEVSRYVTTQKELDADTQTLEDCLEMADPRAKQEQESSNLLVWVTINEALIGIKSAIPQNFTSAPNIQFIDKDGKFALVEKLKMQLCSPSWDIKIKNKKHYQAVIINFVNYILEGYEQEGVRVCTLPFPLESKYFMLSSKRQLKTVKSLKSVPFNYIALEKFIYEVSMKDPELFRYFMSKTLYTYKEHNKEVNFIKEAVLATFEPDRFKLEQKLSGLDRLNDQFLHATINGMRQKMRELHSDICATIELRTTMDEEQKEKIRVLLTALYAKSGTITFFWPNLAEEVLKEYKNSPEGKEYAELCENAM